MKHEVTKDAISDGGNIQWTAGLDDRLTESRFGQKAANLSRMLRSGLPVPSGYVLSVDAFSLVANNAAVRRTEGDAFREVQLEKPATFQAASDRIIRAFREAAFPTELRDVILARADSVSDLRTLAVRSSAVGEDSAGASFAGQLDSVLNVSGEEATIRAITDVWSSYWSPRSLFYQHSRGFKLAGMGVILQHCVDSLAAGVAFSLNPENGDQRELIVEFVAGQGDGLVAGHVNPNRLRICRQTGQTEPYAGSGDDCRAVDLPDVAFVQLRQLVVQLEELFGGPQDVEWVWDGQRILIVQSRPITALSQPGVI